MPAPSTPFKTILELVLWNGLQSCRCITPDIITLIKMSPYQDFLYLREEKKVTGGLDPVNRQGVPTQLDATQKETAVDQQQRSCETLICRHQTILRLLFSAATASTQWRVCELYCQTTYEIVFPLL